MPTVACLDLATGDKAKQEKTRGHDCSAKKPIRQPDSSPHIVSLPLNLLSFRQFGKVWGFDTRRVRP